MKKIACLVGIVLMIASVVYVAETISDKNLPGLKGTWEGMLSWGTVAQAGNSSAKLEILNDVVPVRMRLTLSNVPEISLSQMCGN